MTNGSERRRAHLAGLYLPPDQVAVATHDVSEGPWFGFNGVKTMAISSSSLWLCRDSLFAPGQFWVEVVALSAGGNVALTGKSVVGMFAGKRRQFAARTTQEAVQICNELMKPRE